MEKKSPKKPINYIAKIFQEKPHMLKHNIINMKGEDLLNNLRAQYNLKLRGEKLRRIVNRADKG